MQTTITTLTENVLMDLDPILQQACRLFGPGQTLFVPMNDRGPAIDVNNVSHDAMTDPRYLRRLSQADIGVALGQHSDGLCVSTFQSAAERAEFLVPNPRLANTLVSHTREGYHVWFRCPKAPPSRCLGRINWRSAGNMLVIPRGSNSKLPGKGQVVSTNFPDIVWPEPMRHELQLAWLAMVCPPVIKTAKPRGTLDPQYLARRCIISCYLSFDPELKRFYVMKPHTLPAFVEAYEVMGLLCQTADDCRLDDTIDDAIDSPTEDLLRVAMHQVRIYGAQPLSGGPSGIQRFVRECLEPRPKACITNRDLRREYGNFCNAAGVVPYLGNGTCGALARAIREIYGASRSRSIRRNGKWVRGIRGVAFRASLRHTTGRCGTSGTP